MGGAFGRYFPQSQDYATIGELYHAIELALTSLVEELGEQSVFGGDVASQVGAETVQLPGLTSIANLKDALQAIDLIVSQGEGGRAHNENSHYAQLLGIRREYEDLLARDAGFVPARPVATNPVMRRPPVPDQLVHVDLPEAAQLLEVANAAYTVMLCCMNQAYGRPHNADPAEKRELLDAAIGIMGVVGALGTALSRLPASSTVPGVCAGLNFEAPRAMRPLLHGPKEWRILSYAVHRIADGVAGLTTVANAQALAKRLAAVSGTLAVRGATE